MGINIGNGNKIKNSNIVENAEGFQPVEKKRFYDKHAWISDVTEKVTDVTEKVTDVTEKKIIELLKNNSKNKAVELAEILDISRKTVPIKLKNLREKGSIERVGSDRKGYGNIYL